jgi:ribosomal protein L22
MSKANTPVATALPLYSYSKNPTKIVLFARHYQNPKINPFQKVSQVPTKLFKKVQKTLENNCF